jgi:hypothetical protein
MKTWIQVPKLEWMHRFIHTLETVPKNWYLELEVCKGTRNFKVTFSFEVESHVVDATLQVIRSKIFMEEDHI